MATPQVDLIDLTRARRAFPNLSGTGSDATIQVLITAASRAIERYCHRIFSVQNRDECLDSDGTGILLLRNFPVLSITRLATSPQAVLQIRNTTAGLSRATVATTYASATDYLYGNTNPSTGLTLTRYTGGSAITDATLTWVNYPTVQAVADRINALGNGWLATVQNSQGGWASADINSIQGALSALSGGCQLTIHTGDLSAYDLVPETGEIRFGPAANSSNTYGFLFPGSLTDILPGLSLPRGNRNVRIQYQAGFYTVPEDVQEACAWLTAHLFYSPQRAGGLMSESLGDFSQSFAALAAMPEYPAGLLSAYRDWRV